MAICLGKNILNLDVNICYWVRILQVLPGRTLQTQNKWAVHLRYLTLPLLTCFWKNANCPSTAIFWIQWNQAILVITDLWPGLFLLEMGKILNNILRGGDIILLKCKKKCSTPSCSCLYRTGITRMGREAKGSSWNFCFAAKTKLMGWNPGHTTENCGFYAYIYLHSYSWCWLAQPEPRAPACYSEVVYFPSPHPQTAGNWTELSSFSAVSLIEDVSCVHGISTMVRNFPHSFQDSLGVFLWQQVWNDTAFLCPETSLFL